MKFYLMCFIFLASSYPVVSKTAADSDMSELISEVLSEASAELKRHKRDAEDDATAEEDADTDIVDDVSPDSEDQPTQDIYVNIHEKKNHISKADLDITDQDNLPDFAVETDRDDSFGSIDELNDLSQYSTDSMNDGNLNTDTAGSQDNYEFLTTGGSSNQVVEEQIVPEYRYPLKTPSDSTGGSSQIVEEKIVPEYRYPLKTPSGSADGSNQVVEETIVPEYRYPLKTPSGSTGGSNQAVEELIVPEYRYPLKTPSGSTDGSGYNQVFEEPIVPEYRYPLKTPSASTGGSNQVFEEQIIPEYRYPLKSPSGSTGGGSGRPKYSNTGVTLHYPTGYGSSQIGATQLPQTGYASKPTGANKQRYSPPQTNQMGRKGNNYQQPPNYSSRIQKPGSYAASSLTNPSRPGQQMKPTPSSGMGKFVQGILPHINRMFSKRQGSLGNRPDIEVVIDCSSCGESCPPSCDNYHPVASYCCTGTIAVIPDICPGCPFIDTSKCPVSASEFDPFNEMYYILEIGLREPYVTEMSETSSPTFQRIRQTCQKFILSVYYDHPYYQDTLVKSIKNSKDYSIVSMLVRFTKSSLGNISPLYKALMCKCGCDIFYTDLYFKLVPANITDIFEFCPRECLAPSVPDCSPHSACHMCCQGSGPTTYMLQKIPSFGPSLMGPIGFAPQSMPLPIIPSMLCPFGCPDICAPFCSDQCCYGQAGFKRSINKSKTGKNFIEPKRSHKV